MLVRAAKPITTNQSSNSKYRNLTRVCPRCVGVRLPVRVAEDAEREEQRGERRHDNIAHPTRQVRNAGKEVHAASSATSSKRPDAREPRWSGTQRLSR